MSCGTLAEAPNLCVGMVEVLAEVVSPVDDTQLSCASSRRRMVMFQSPESRKERGYHHPH